MRITGHFCNTGTCTFTIPLNRLIKESDVTVLMRKPEKEKNCISRTDKRVVT